MKLYTLKDNKKHGENPTKSSPYTKMKVTVFSLSLVVATTFDTLSVVPLSVFATSLSEI